MNGRVLIIAAHPDDDVLGCGGVISRFKGSAEFRVVYIAEGSTCRFENPDSIKAKREIDIRNKYAINSLKILGIDSYKFYNLPCGRLDQVPQLTINKIIESEISYFKPNIVLTHTQEDSNIDHRKVLDSTIIATRAGSGVDKLLSYEVISSTECGYQRSFTPNIFYSLNTINIQDKCKSFECYSTEIQVIPKPRNKDNIIALAKMRGYQAGYKYAEAFKLIREFI